MQLLSIVFLMSNNRKIIFFVQTAYINFFKDPRSVVLILKTSFFFLSKASSVLLGAEEQKRKMAEIICENSKLTN